MPRPDVLSERRGAYIAGIGGQVPGAPIGNEHFADVGVDASWVRKRTGIVTRHWITDTQSLLDLAVVAARAALDDAGLSSDDLDFIIASTITADLVTPGLGPQLAGALGAKQTPAVDLNAACAGFIFALDYACALIDSGRAQTVLVCAAEALSRITNRQDRSTAVLFGDGAGAVVVRSGPAVDGIQAFCLGGDAGAHQLLFADRDERLLRMDGPAVYEAAVSSMVTCTTEACARAGVDIDELDLFVAHQANARILRAVCRELGISDEVAYVHVDRVANTSSASIPLALHAAEVEGRLAAGDRVGVVAFGAGFTWGAGILSWKPNQAPIPAKRLPTHKREIPSHEGDTA